MRRGKIWQRTTALFLAAAMLVTQAPVQNFRTSAAEILSDEGETLIIEPEEGEAESGTDGGGAGSDSIVIEGIEDVTPGDGGAGEDGSFELSGQESEDTGTAESGTESETGAAEPESGTELTEGEAESETEPAETEFTETVSEVESESGSSIEVMSIETAENPELLAAPDETNIGSIRFGVTRLSGGTVIQDESGKNQDDRVLIGRGLENGVTVNLQASAEFGMGKAKKIFFTMKLPYFYYDSKNNLRTTYAIDEVPRDQRPGQENAMYVSATPTGVDPEFWDVENNKSSWGEVEYRGFTELTANNSVVLSVKLAFEGPVPENTAAFVYLGGGYESSEDAFGDEHGGYEALPDVGPGTAQYMLICSNLQWEIQVEAVEPKNVLWDQYNYLVYKETLKNTSEKDSIIRSVDPLSLALPLWDDGWGLRVQEAMKWKIVGETDNGEYEVEENSNYTPGAREERYIGIPGKGGALIFDVTGISEETRKTWNLVTCDNFTDDDGNRLSPLPYYFPSDSRISLDTGTIDLAPGEKKEYYFAVPMPTLKPSNQVIASSMWATIHFGTENMDYTWTKSASNTTHDFEEPAASFKQEKYVLTADGKKAAEKDVSINEELDYYLGGFENNGNLPVFGAYAQDTMDPAFVMNTIRIEMNAQDGETPQLSDWFRENNTVEFEIASVDQEGQTLSSEFVPLGQFAEDGGAQPGMRVWTLDAKSALENYLAANSGQDPSAGRVFTGRFRIWFKDRIERGEALDGVIKVNGLYEVGGTYQNVLETYYEHYVWLTNEKDYSHNKHWTDQAVVTTNVAKADPRIRTDVFYEDSISDPLTVPVNVRGGGYRYLPGNVSTSKMIPGCLDSGTLLSDTADSPKGFLAKEILLSERLVKETVLDELVLYAVDGTEVSCFFSNETGADGAVILSLDGTELARNEKGEYVIPESFWETSGALGKFTLAFSYFPAEQELENDFYASVEGLVNVVTPQTVEGTFRAEARQNMQASDTAQMNVANIAPRLQGLSRYDGKTSSPLNTAPEFDSEGNEISQQQVYGLTVPNRETAQYEFYASNACVSPMGETALVLDIRSAGDKLTNSDLTAVRGFDTERVILSGFTGEQQTQETDPEDADGTETVAGNPVADIREIRFYDWDWNERNGLEGLPSLTDDPDAVTASDAFIRMEDGSVAVELSDADGNPLVTRKDGKAFERIRYIIIVCDEFYGQTNVQKPDRMTITVEGNTDWYDNLDAGLTIRPENETMKTLSLTDRLTVDRPGLGIHADIEYYQLDSVSQSSSSNTDQNQMILAVPYDRIFTYRVLTENKNPSRLEEIDLTVSLPLGDKTGEEADTGFHTTEVEISRALLRQFEQPDSVAVTFYDVDDVKNNGAGVRFVSFAEKDGTPEEEYTFISEDGKTELRLNDDGNMIVSEAELISFGIDGLKKVLITGKDYGTQTGSVDSWIDIRGFSDSIFATQDIVKVNAVNYMGCLRQEPDFEVKTSDQASAYISRMYFDTAIEAGYRNKDSASANRFDATATPYEHVRQYYYAGSSAAYWKDNSELDVGYKSVGSYLVDFRQYLNVGKNYPASPTNCGTYSQEHQDMPYVYTQSLNTAAEVTLHIDVPEDSFETYYLKVHPKAFEFIRSITVERADGSTRPVSVSGGNSVETADGQQYCRIDLTEGTDSSIYRAPDDVYRAVNPVSKVTVTLAVNSDESEGADAKDPDYGTWFAANDQSTKYMFEITGRFYKSGAANAAVTADLKIGGTKRDGVTATAKVRTQNGADSNPSSWSWWNKYRYHYPSGWGWSSSEAYYDARHLSSSVHVNVLRETNTVVKGVHETPSVTGDLNAKYGTYNEFAVSFSQAVKGSANDYATGQGSNWKSQDAHDWSGRHAYTDRLVLTDSLPMIRPDADYEYYGFKTTDIFLSGVLYPFIDKVEVTIEKRDDSGDAQGENRTVSISRQDLLQSEEKEGEPYHAGFYQIPVFYPQDGTVEPAGAIVLGENEFVKEYAVYLSNLYGDGDYAAEFAAFSDSLRTSTDHGTKDKPDVYVGGSVYFVRPVSGSVPAEAYNTMEAEASDSEGGDTPDVYEKTEDNGYIMSYRLPFRAGLTLNAAKPEKITYDYAAEGDGKNKEPDYAPYEVRIWNRADADQEIGKSARIERAIVNNELNTYYRLKHIYIPAEFVEGNWFHIEKLELNGAFGKTEYSFKDLTDAQGSGYPYFARDEKTGCYVFDVNAFVRRTLADNPDSFERYADSEMNNGAFGGVYVKEKISSFTVVFSAVDPDDCLNGGEYLNADRQTLTSAPQAADADPVYWYDGVFVDRTGADIGQDAWTLESRPSLINPNKTLGQGTTTQTGDYRSAALYHFVSATFESADSDAENYQGDLTTDAQKQDYYYLRNLVGNLKTDLSRGTKLSEDSEEAFAYDVDLSEGQNIPLGQDREHLRPDDYIEYHLTVGASSDSALSLYHPDVRFTAPEGQRVVGWRIESIPETSVIKEDDITAAVLIDGEKSDFEKNRIYSLEPEEKADTGVLASGEPERPVPAGTETDYKQLDISIGTLSGDQYPTLDEKVAANEVKAGEEFTFVIVTQLTDELSPYEGKKIEASFFAAARPLHTFSQYRINWKSEDTAASVSATSPYVTDSTEDARYYRYMSNGFYGFDRENTFLSEVRSDVTFYSHDWNPKVDITYDDLSKQYDRQAATIRINGSNDTPLENGTNHTLDSVTYSVSFLSERNGLYYKGFDLTEKPEMTYPGNMSGNRPVKTEYCYYGDKGTERGPYEQADAEGEVWIDEASVIAADELTEEQEAAGCRLLKDAVMVRWTYYDIPAKGTDGENVVFASADAPFLLKGLARYRDIRQGAEFDTTAAADRYDVTVTVDVSLVHKHDELVDNSVIGKETEGPAEQEFLEVLESTGHTVSTRPVAMESPVLTVHTQIFEDEEQAQAAYDAAAEQKTGYRPGDTAWFKTTVINTKLDESQADKRMQGALLEPVVFDKIPEYVSADALEKPEEGSLHIVWYDRDGVQKNVPSYTVTKEEFTAPDYGGDMVTEKADTDGSSMVSGHAFADLKLGADGNTESTQTDYTVYKIAFAEGSLMETGDRMEIWYEVRVREEGLPLAYTVRGETDGAFVDYYPKIGEYYQKDNSTRPYYTNVGYPFASLGNTALYSFNCSEGRINNENILMDMNFLCHDVGVSGRRNEGVDKYAYLKNSNVYMPGCATDESSSEKNTGGSNGYLKDYDMSTGANCQNTKYIPGLSSGAKPSELPESVRYVKGDTADNNTAVKSRDYYAYLMELRNGSADWAGHEREDGAGHEDAVIWTQARMHLQTAWLAASSQIIGDTSDYLKSTEYLRTVQVNEKADTHKTTNSTAFYNGRTMFYNDDTITTLEYGQDFTARLGAYNYGDWDLTDGVEFVYVLPEGISPKGGAGLSADDVTVRILSGGNSKNPSYTVAGGVSVSAVEGAAKTPATMRDPILGSAQMDRTDAAAVETYTDAQYLDGRSWVVTVRVPQPLKKWFGRETESGYIMQVDIPCHVDKTPATEYWYDEVLVRPLRPEAQDSLYYQIYDTTSLWGNTNPLVLSQTQGASFQISTQYAGMDYLWSSYFSNNSSYSPDGRQYINGSPNMPYINGMNISNREVSAQNAEDATGKEKFSSGKRSTYASTGTRAHMRKPLVRTWTTIGEEHLEGTAAEDYYVNPLGDTSTMNIILENKYWGNTLTPDFSWYYSHHEYYKYKHTYATDGGNKGTLWNPVVTDILPPGVVPKNTDGGLFTEDNEANARMELDWTLYTSSYSTDTPSAFAADDAEKAKYRAEVTYILLGGGADGQEGRFQVTFSPVDEASVASESRRCFSWNFFTNGVPDKRTGEESDDGLLDQYQRNHVFVTSSLENYRFLIDSDIAQNPFWVGNTKVTSYNGKANTSTYPYYSGIVPDVRRDIAGTDASAKDGMLPQFPVTSSYSTKYAIDSSETKGNVRYREGDTIEMESYTDVRPSLTLPAQDFNGNGSADAIMDCGVHTTNAVRVKYPSLEDQTFVSVSQAEDVTDLGGRGGDTYYPGDPDADENASVQYGDYLYYHVKITNNGNAQDYIHTGDTVYGKFVVSVVLPKIVSYVDSDEITAEDLYLIWKEKDGQSVKIPFDELEDYGFRVNMRKREISEDLTETLVFEVITAGSGPDPENGPAFSGFVTEGEKLPGYFGRGDTLVLGIRAFLDRTEDTELMDTDETYWDGGYSAGSYVAVEEQNADYLRELFEQGGFERIGRYDLSRAEWIRRKDDAAGSTEGGASDGEEGDEDSVSIDYDLDEMYDDVYTTDTSAAVTIRKPHATLRLDTSVQRVEVSNPDLSGNSQRVVDDPTVKGAERMYVYLDQAVNDGTAVKDFVVDLRIPFRGTDDGTTVEAGAGSYRMESQLYAVATGLWELPQEVEDEEEEYLKDLELHVYALLCENGKAPADDDGISYISPTDTDTLNAMKASGEFVDLTELAFGGGVSINENHVIDMTALTARYKDTYPNLNTRTYELYYVISSKDGNRRIPRGLRMAVDADPKLEGSQEMDEIDPERENLNPLPESVVSKLSFHAQDNTIDSDHSEIGAAAFVMISVVNNNELKKHINYFAIPFAKYDDVPEHFAQIGERARAGYFVSNEKPVIQIDLKAKYFKFQGSPDNNYKWDPDITVSEGSRMLRYSASIQNLSNDMIGSLGLDGAEADRATRVQISSVLPYVQVIDMAKDENGYQKYPFVEYLKEGSCLNEDYTAPRGQALTEKDAGWTWHVENEDGEWIKSPMISSVELEMYDKVVSLSDGRQRRVLTFTSAGYLEPGQKLVIDFLVPVSTEEAGLGDSTLLDCKAYGFKSGAFLPYIPNTDSSLETYAYELDRRDINNNGLEVSETTIVKTLGGLAFNINRVLSRRKVSYSEYGHGLNAGGNDNNRPSLVPEGSIYSFESMALNPTVTESFEHPVVYDVLPYENDHSILGVYTEEDGYRSNPRYSKWRGYIRLDTLKVKLQAGGGEADELVDGKDVNIWVGPFKYNGKNIEIQPVSTLPTIEETYHSEFWNQLLESDTEKQKYFVRLKDVMSAPNRSELERAVQAIYAEPVDPDFQLFGNTKIVLSYDMKAPLNLPLFSGCISEQDASDAELTAAVMETISYNSFVVQTGTSNPEESAYTGVYLDAPQDKGYIGHYVWLDENYSAAFTDDAEYYQRAGRWIRSGGADPGINGVKVELLSENGYPVNCLGVPVMETDDGKYAKLDAETGAPVVGPDGNYLYEVYGPEYYITETDAYGNNGYFIMSNLEPGRYRLRYTFPDSVYDEYAVTTRYLGQDGVKAEVYRPGDTLMGETVERLTVVMKEAVTVDAIGTDPETYASYDERMTSFDLGVAPAYIYGGYAWKDTDGTDGWRADSEKPVKNVSVTLYEIDSEGNLTPSYNADGEENTGLLTDEQGYFETTLYPYRSYIAAVDTGLVTDGVYEPSPMTHSVNPMEYPQAPVPSSGDQMDNDLMYDKQHSLNATGAFTAGLDKTVTNGNGSYGPFIRLGFGFVPAGVGYIGKYVFEDVNYNGIRDQYTDENGYPATEPGVDGLKLVLEQYYYDGSAGKWEYVDDYAAETSSGSSYIFEEVPTTFTVKTEEDGSDSEELCLAGYRVKIKMTADDQAADSAGTVDDGSFVPTKYHMGRGAGENGADLPDSDLPVTDSDETKSGQFSGDGAYRYLDEAVQIIARKAQESDKESDIRTVDGESYCIREALTILDIDAGLTRKEQGTIEGIIWEDADYDGVRSADGQENGIAGITLSLVPYIYTEDGWKALEKDDLADRSAFDAYAAKAVTGTDGKYCFDAVPSTAQLKSKDEPVLAGYQIQVTSDLHAVSQDGQVRSFAVTKYMQGDDPAVDSNLWLNAGKQMLHSAGEYTVVAKEIPQEEVDSQYGTDPQNKAAYLIRNGLGWFDILKTENRDGFDGGLKEFEKSSVSGRVWIDADYDGIMDGLPGEPESEKGLEGLTLVLERYYLEDGTWKEDVSFVKQETKTDADGLYEFGDLESFVLLDETYCLAGYRVSVKEHPDTSKYAVTLYRMAQEEGQRDSDLNGLDLNGQEEYILLAEPLEKEQGESQDRMYTSEYGGSLYDPVKALPQGCYDAGYREYPVSLITGTVFDDINYNGRIDEDEAVKEMEGFSEKLREAVRAADAGAITVTATAYYRGADTDWQLYHPNGTQEEDDVLRYQAVIGPDSPDGRYELEVPTMLRVDGKNYLAGYTMEIDLIPDGYHPTMHPAGGDGRPENALLKLSGQDGALYAVRKTDRQGVYRGQTGEELEGRIVAAVPSGSSQSANLIRGYDIAANRTLVQYNIGYSECQTSSISGVIFKDNNRNGRYDPEADVVQTGSNQTNDAYEADEPLSGIGVGVVRYAWDADQGEWIEAPNPDGGDTKYYAVVDTKADGTYEFTDLPTHADHGESGDVSILYGYTVWLLDMPEGPEGEPLAAAYYQANEDGADSALVADTMQLLKQPENPAMAHGEMKDGCTVTAEKIPDDASEAAYPELIERYDFESGTARGSYNAGFTDFLAGSIEGTAFEDMDYDGILDGDDRLTDGVTVGLKRFLYDSDGGRWLQEEEFEEETGETGETGESGETGENGAQAPDEYFRTAVTDQNGNYRFENLATYTVKDGVRYLYGYELWLIEDASETPQAATKYQMNGGTDDSALTVGRQIVKRDGMHEEMLDGKLIAAKKLGDGRDDTVSGLYMIEGYHIVEGALLTDYNAGFVPDKQYEVSGTVWSDDNRNGIADDEHPLSGVEVTLERLYYADGNWKELPGEKDSRRTVKTGSDGSYCFDGLEAAGELDGKTVLYGYQAKIETLPERYGVTMYQANHGKNDSDLNEMTGYLEDTEKLIIPAAKADEDTAPEYAIGEYSTVWGASKQELDAGLQPYGTASLEGIVFAEEDEDGLFEDGETTLDRKTLYLEYRSGESFVSFQNKSAVTDETGRYRFENLPVFDGEGKPYEYRIRMDVPDGYELTKTHSFDLNQESGRNVFEAAKAEDAEAQKTAVSPSVSLAVRESKANYYGLEWKTAGQSVANLDAGYLEITSDETEGDIILPGKDWTKRSPDPSDDITVEQTGEVKTGDDTPLWLYLTLLLISGTGAAAAGFWRKRRKIRR